MNTPVLAELTDLYPIDAALKLDRAKRSLFGQYMTPAPIGQFMASLFTQTSGDMRVLDAGAGVGSPDFGCLCR